MEDTNRGSLSIIEIKKSKCPSVDEDYDSSSLCNNPDNSDYRDDDVIAEECPNLNSIEINNEYFNESNPDTSEEKWTYNSKMNDGE